MLRRKIGKPRLDPPLFPRPYCPPQLYSSLRFVSPYFKSPPAMRDASRYMKGVMSYACTPPLPPSAQFEPLLGLAWFRPAAQSLEDVPSSDLAASGAPCLRGTLTVSLSIPHAIGAL